LPVKATEAFTKNLIELSGGGAIVKTGACAKLSKPIVAAARNGTSARYLVFINFLS
jgi:hypothetical protein